MPESKKQSSRTTLKDDAMRAIDQVCKIVPDDLWVEFDRFAGSNGSAQIADLHDSLQTEVDLLLLKVMRSLYSSNSSLFLRCAPESIRLATLARLKLSVLKLAGIEKKTSSLDRPSAMLFYCLFSDSPDHLQSAFVKEASERQPG